MSKNPPRGRQNWLAPSQRNWVGKRLRKRTQAASVAIERCLAAEDIAESLSKGDNAAERLLTALFSPTRHAPPRPAHADQIGVSRIGLGRIGTEDRLGVPSAAESDAVAFEIAREALKPLRAKAPAPLAGDLARLASARLGTLIEAAKDMSDGQLVAVTLFLGTVSEVSLRSRLIDAGRV